MGLKWEEIPPTIRTNVEKSITMHINSMDGATFCSFLQGSVEMGYNWNQRKRNAFVLPRLKVLVQDKKDFNLYGAGRVLSSMVYHLGESTAIDYCDILENKEFQKAIFSGIECCSGLRDALSISNILLGEKSLCFFLTSIHYFFLSRLGKLGFYYSSIPLSTKRVLSDWIYETRNDGTAHGCSSILSGLAGMEASWDQIEEKTCQGILEKIKNAKENFNLHVSSSYFHFLFQRVIVFMFYGGFYFFLF
jgi:hypothetical protein